MDVWPRFEKRHCRFFCKSQTFSGSLQNPAQTINCFTAKRKFISLPTFFFFFLSSFVLADTPLLPLAAAMGSCLWDSWAYFHLPNTKNSSRTTLLLSHHSYSSQGLLTSLLISLNVLWFGQYVFTVWAKKCWGHHTPRGGSCETQLGQKLWIILWELCLIPDKSACQCGSPCFTTLVLLLQQEFIESSFSSRKADRKVGYFVSQRSVFAHCFNAYNIWTFSPPLFFAVKQGELNNVVEATLCLSLVLPSSAKKGS